MRQVRRDQREGRDVTFEECLLHHVLSVVEPGETISYGDLIARLGCSGLPTGGVGRALMPFREDPLPLEPRGELRCWMGDRVWDEDYEGGWVKTALLIARRGELAYGDEITNQDEGPRVLQAGCGTGKNERRRRWVN